MKREKEPATNRVVPGSKDGFRHKSVKRAAFVTFDRPEPVLDGFYGGRDAQKDGFRQESGKKADKRGLF